MNSEWVEFDVEPGIGEKAALLSVPAQNILAATTREELRGGVTHHLLIKGWDRWLQVSKETYEQLARRLGL